MNSEKWAMLGERTSAPQFSETHERKISGQIFTQRIESESKEEKVREPARARRNTRAERKREPGRETRERKGEERKKIETENRRADEQSSYEREKERK